MQSAVCASSRPAAAFKSAARPLRASLSSSSSAGGTTLAAARPAPRRAAALWMAATAAAAPEAPVLPFRVGHGWDLHRLEPGYPLIVGGIDIPHDRGCVAHSGAAAGGGGDLFCGGLVRWGSLLDPPPSLPEALLLPWPHS